MKAQCGTCVRILDVGEGDLNKIQEVKLSRMVGGVLVTSMWICGACIKDNERKHGVHS